MSELNIPGFIAFLRGEVTIDGHWFGGDGPIRGGIRRNFWWREHLPKLSSHIERQDAEIAQLRADLSESRRLLDEARAVASEYLSARGACEIPHGHALPKPRRYNEPEIVRYRSAITALTNIALSAPVPAQPADFRTRLIELCQQWTPANLDRCETPEEIIREVAEGPHSQTADKTIGQATKYAHDIVTWLHRDHYSDNTAFEPFDDLLGLLSQIDNMICGWKEPAQPAAVPEAVAKDGAYQSCLRDVLKQLVLMMDDCEEHADGRITIDCDTGADQFLRRIYDLLNALEIYTPDCVDEAFTALLSASDTEVKNG